MEPAPAADTAIAVATNIELNRMRSCMIASGLPLSGSHGFALPLRGYNPFAPPRRTKFTITVTAGLLRGYSADISGLPHRTTHAAPQS